MTTSARGAGPSGPGQLRLGPFLVDRDERRLLRGGEVVPLKPRVFALLEVLVATAGRLVTKEELLATLWPGTHVTDAVVKTHVHDLRRAFGDCAHFLATERGRGYRLIAPVTTEGAADDAGELVEREAERAAVASHLGAAAAGRRRLVLVTGEPGIGKTALLGHVMRTLAPNLGFRSAIGRCLEHVGEQEAYLPVFELLGDLLRAESDLAASLAAIAPAWAIQVPAAVGLARATAAAAIASAGGPWRALGSLAEWLERISEDVPTLLVLEDLQWSDPSTLDLVAYLARRSTPARLAVLVSLRRPPTLADRHPWRRIEAELLAHGHCAVVPLPPLSRQGVADLLIAAGASGDQAEELHRRSGGNPLFATALIRQAAGDPATSVPPEDVRELVGRLLADLGDADRALLEVASVLGDDVDPEVLSIAADQPATAVDERCAALARQGLILRFDPARAAYRFAHAVFREVLYERLGAMRRRELHRRVGRSLLERPDLSPASAVARHLDRAGLAAEAVAPYRRAAQVAFERSAFRLAETLARRGLELVERLQPSPARLGEEARLSGLLGAALANTAGYVHADADAAFRRATAIFESADETPRLGMALLGTWGYWLVRGDLERAVGLGERLRRTAVASGDRALLGEAWFALGSAQLFRGAIAPGREALERAAELAVADRDRVTARTGRDPKVAADTALAWACWHAGRRERASQLIATSDAEARERRQPQTLAFALFYAALLCAVDGRSEDAVAPLAELAELTAEHGFEQWRAFGDGLTGWASAMAGRDEQSRQAFAASAAWFERSGASLSRPILLAFEADAARVGGDFARALRLLDEATGLAESTGELHWMAQLHLLRARCLDRLRAARPRDEANVWRVRAHELATRQGSRALALRAAVDLAQVAEAAERAPALERLRREVAHWPESGDGPDLAMAHRLLRPGLRR